MSRAKIDNLIPRDYEAECATLGSVLLQPSVMDDLIEMLEPCDFWWKEHQAAFAIFQQMASAGENIDAVAINADPNRAAAVGGVGKLVELAESVPSAASAKHYAAIVADRSHKRKLLQVADRIIHEAQQSTSPSIEQQRQAEQWIFELGAQRRETSVIELKRAVHDTVEKLQQVAEGKPDDRIPTGFSDLDQRLGDMRPGSLLVVAGETSMGKSAFSLTLAYNMARLNYPTLYFSLEMSPEELSERILSAGSGVEKNAFRDPASMDEGEWGRVYQVAADASAAGMFIADTPALGMRDLGSISRRCVRQLGVRAIFVDYLQIMEYPNPGDEVASIRQLTGGMKVLARQLEVPIVCVSQLRRKGTTERDDREPKISDLHGSSSIEKDANAVILLHRKAHYHRLDEGWIRRFPGMVNKAAVLIAKQRNGPVGRIWMHWDGKLTRFSQLAQSEWGDDTHEE